MYSDNAVTKKIYEPVVRRLHFAKPGMRLLQNPVGRLDLLS